MATFSQAPQRVNAMIEQVVLDYYPDLVEAKATIAAVFAHPDLDETGEPKGPAMKKNGMRILAKIKAHGEEDRAGGSKDATITFDAAEWAANDDDPLMGRRRQLALIDHELRHLIVKRSKRLPGQALGAIMTDDSGRPLFKMRPHDWEITGFRDVAERHGVASYEVREARQFANQHGGLLYGSVGPNDMGICPPRAEPKPVDARSIMETVAAQVNAGALGPDVTMTVNPARPPVVRDATFAREILGMTVEAIREINRDHKAVGMPEPFPNANGEVAEKYRPESDYAGMVHPEPFDEFTASREAKAELARTFPMNQAKEAE